MDLTFQVPMQYCSLQHQILPLSPVTSTAGYSFCFGSIPSFFLELLLIALCSSLVAHGTPSDLGAHLLVSYLFAFSYCSWGSQGKNTELVCHSLLQCTIFCHDIVGVQLCSSLSILGGSWWRDLTESGPLEKGMANHFSILALRTP